MGLAAQKANARFNDRNRLTTKKGRTRLFCKTPYGHAVTAKVFLDPLTDFLAGNLSDKPDKPPVFLRGLISQLKLADYRAPALIGLSRLLDPIFRGWDREDPSAAQKLKFKIGEDIYVQLVPKGLRIPFPWKPAERLKAGDWLLEQTLALDFFTYEDGFSAISEKWRPELSRIHDEMIRARPVHMPLFEPPPAWTGWFTVYPGGVRTPFVRRDWYPETRVAIEKVFENPEWLHSTGVNALQHVPFKIDTEMLPLVERHAVEVMGHVGKKRAADEITVAADIADARYLGERPFYVPRNVDKRGRINSVCHFNFDRGDHVRSLFRFARGMPLGEEVTYWLEVHCANCNGEDGIDKKPLSERIDWVATNHSLIQNIANDPDGTFEKWRGVDSPFCFVAACRELAAAWKDPNNFETHLPIGFDGSCNGLQHLAYLARDPKTAYLVNIGPNPDSGIFEHEPQDVYQSIVAKVIELLNLDDDPWARWWLRRFDELGTKKTRKLIKTPAMTYAYSATQGGMRDQIKDVYDGYGSNQPADDQSRPKGRRDGCSYLAGKVIQACKSLLKAPTEVMKYIRDLTKHRLERGLFLEWTTPSGFPVSNRYQEPNIEIVPIYRSGIRVVRHNIADGYKYKIIKRKTLNSAPANFVHSLDAAHLVRVVNTALGQLIQDIITTHDCYYCLAPHALVFNRIIRWEMGDMYRQFDPLADLRNRNVDHDIFPRRPHGELDPLAVNFSETAFS